MYLLGVGPAHMYLLGVGPAHMFFLRLSSLKNNLFKIIIHSDFNVTQFTIQDVLIMSHEPGPVDNLKILI